MMTLLPLHGRRIHIAGNVDCAPSIATAEELKLMRDFVRRVPDLACETRRNLSGTC